MAEYKNKNEAKGNFGIYQISLFEKLFKIGKTDLDRVTKSSGEPTRLHQQVRKLREEHGIINVFSSIIRVLFGATTEDAKAEEKAILDKIVEQTGEVPEGNQKSFNPKK